ncbi:hypothetical protein O6H91_19G047200 [Diphasiastrum complanatum]|uniref:Uncharacterized protein n=1 Tax=Diphasiastrum complanatum TaxID=34168 RepID=A0ACC2AUT2_DIPCM|nr:hypothetical protein O6H91_19G047200 [Diphasiastrum complanatum]
MGDSQLQLMLATILLTCAPADALELWRSIEEHLVDDYVCEFEDVVGGDISQVLIDRALHDVEQHMQAVEKSLSNYGFVLPTINMEYSPLFREETFLSETMERVEIDISHLNGDHRGIFDCVVYGHVERQQSGVFFVDDLGGIGKTFLYNVMLSYVRAKGWIVVAIASSGIATLLMKGGRTAHSRFKIPPNDMHETSTGNISKQSELGRLIMAC